MLQVKNLSAYYKSSSNKNIIFENISFSINKNSFTALCGTNGCGKSTLLSLLDGIIPEGISIEGEILLNGKNIFLTKRKEVAQKISYLIQNENPIWNITVSQFLETGFYSLESISKQEKTEKIVQALNQFNILDLSQKKVFQLSGGEFQKCRLARSFVQETDILLFDEPVENLDIPFQNKLLQTLQNIQNKKTIIFSIHDINLAATYVDNFILFNNKKIIIGNRKQIFTNQTLSSAYHTNAKIYIHPELKKEQVLFL